MGEHASEPCFPLQQLVLTLLGDEGKDSGAAVMIDELGLDRAALSLEVRRGARGWQRVACSL